MNRLQKHDRQTKGNCGILTDQEKDAIKRAFIRGGHATPDQIKKGVAEVAAMKRSGILAKLVFDRFADLTWENGELRFQPYWKGPGTDVKANREEEEDVG